jgi:hypothetical protein
MQGHQAPRRTWRKERGHMTTRATTDNTGASPVRRDERQKSTETKSAYKTTEFIVYVLAVLGVLIASMIVDQSFGADPAWRYVTYLTVGYMISRGLAKAGSREPYRD